jgi:hypothetical protein
MFETTTTPRNSFRGRGVHAALYRLWNNGDDDAIVCDRENGIFAGQLVREVDRASSSGQGRHFVAPSPQAAVLRRPGPRARPQVAGAESVFGIFPTPKRAGTPTTSAHADSHGRGRNGETIYGLQTIIDQDKSRASDKYAECVEGADQGARRSSPDILVSIFHARPRRRRRAPTRTSAG